MHLMRDRQAVVRLDHTEDELAIDAASVLAQPERPHVIFERAGAVGADRLKS
ncbi:MAG: hypothetical protein ACREPJ_03940 [Rhodanobacteraceae bacterium]